MLWLGGLLGLLLVAAFFGARPAYRGIKKWRAATLTAKADELLRQERLDEAFDGYRAGLELHPVHLPALRGMARIYTAIEAPQALAYWRSVLNTAQATPEDRDAFITLALKLRRFDLAEQQIRQLLQQDPPSDSALIHAMEMYFLQGDYRRSAAFAETLWRRDPSRVTHAVRLAMVQIRLPNPTNRPFALSLLRDAARMSPLERAYALSIMRQAPDLPLEETRTVLAAFHATSTNSLSERLALADIELRMEPERRPVILNQILASAPSPGPRDKEQIGLWLLTNQEPERLLEFITPTEAREHPEMLRQRVVALVTLKRWEEVEREMAHPGTMDELMVHVIRAVTARARNQLPLMAEHWRRAAELAQTERNLQRRFASYAIQFGAYDKALPVVQSLLPMPLDRLRAFRQLAHIYEATGNVEGVRSVMRDWAKDAPDDPTPRTAYVHLSGLVRRDLSDAETQGRELVRSFPDRLAPRAALALVLLRKDKTTEALELFSRIRPELDLALPSWRAVYAAVLDANGQTEQARAILQPIKPEMLRPEERQLVEQLLPAGG